MSEPQEVVSKEAFVEVDVTTIGQEKSDNRRIRIRPFISATANVSVNAGATVNLGNYESARINVMLSMPCYPEEIDEVFEKAKEWVDIRLGKEVKELKTTR